MVLREKATVLAMHTGNYCESISLKKVDVTPFDATIIKDFLPRSLGKIS